MKCVQINMLFWFVPHCLQSISVIWHHPNLVNCRCNRINFCDQSESFVFCLDSGCKLTQFCQKNIVGASVPPTGSLFKVQWTPSFNHLNTHLVSKICHNENEAESEASEVFPPLHGEPPWKTIIIPDRKITKLNFHHTAPLFQTSDIFGSETSFTASDDTSRRRGSGIVYAWHERLLRALAFPIPVNNSCDYSCLTCHPLNPFARKLWNHDGYAFRGSSI